jgi:hypothetical protein
LRDHATNDARLSFLIQYGNEIDYKRGGEKGVVRVVREARRGMERSSQQ